MSSDYQFKTDTTAVYLDTEKLWAYGERIQQVLNRTLGAEKRLEDLFKVVGHVDLIKIAERYLREGNETGLRKCINYLNETAAAFEKAETMIADAVRGG